ncbi:2-amino-4-hydroxy-6-hydroxymethyldihydropteridine diphosphokinase [Parvularcula flava]|uniref:2-amino-4-hydroxy-6-hydroxymethyldihydropteridine pyrophosphokinase n=1 Tax=Aquisalinus luteolus TaxID=1566827 RepID=A0A8J3A2P8_9PROT|nr:2-amino-4-hydroxy-6-hydroxymethyldihydropteridine diphosphokinase [Aquisalinus luteolus]NHK27556.1 2-amino-4-hydroxy-6-hydroxymethyldihydropteridine diphosphokinase [Aquisalinus luteolus]GGH95793.1 7,8-dihydro-6-hydroxymethylpterin-pyrophosphokinase [Aquisalinus luteolus]
MIIIALGSNKTFCGQLPGEIVTKAMDALVDFGSGQRRSSLYSSPAWPDPTEPPYVNAVTSFEQSHYTPEQLLASLHAVEDAFGRERAYLQDPALRYAPRTLDLDLIAYHGEAREGAAESLHLPHPALAERDFVLLPLREISPSWQHPESSLSVEEMISALPQVTATRI